MEKPWWIAAIVTSLIAIALGTVATQVAWGTADQVSGETIYRAFSVATDGPGLVEQRTPWSETSFERDGGIGYLRLAGPILVVGMLFTLFGAIAGEHAAWFKPAGAGPASVLSHGIGALMVVVAIVLLPLGLKENLDWAEARGTMDAGTGMSWGAGLYVGIGAAVLTLLSFAASLVASLRSGESG
jgi:hypothetical protein